MLILFLTFFIIPLFYTGYLSLFDANVIKREFVGLNNFRYLFGSVEFYQILRNMVKYWLCIVPVGVVLPLLLSVLIMELPSKWASLFRGLFYLPTAVGGIVLVAVWVWIFNVDYGLLNYLLSLFGIDPIAWLGNTQTSAIAISLVYLMAVSCSHFTLIYCSAIQGLPQEVIEAAKLDGAGTFSLLRFIVLPLLKPSVAYILLFTTVASIRFWAYPKLFTEGGPLHSSASFGYWVYETAFIRQKFGLASAEAILMLLFTLSFSIIIMRTHYDVS